MLRTISDHLRGADQIPLIFDCGDSVDTLMVYLRMAREIELANVILCGLSLPRDLYELVLTETGQRDTAVVLLRTDCPAEIIALHEHAYAVGWSDNELAYKAVKLLLAAGHRKVGTVHHARYAARFQGYLRALKDCGIEPDPNLVISGDDIPYGHTSITNHGVMRNLERFLLRDDISAFFAPTELLTLAIPVLLLKNGRMLHRDVSFCGLAYPDWLGVGFDLPITYIRFPVEAAAREVLDILLTWSITARGSPGSHYVLTDNLAKRIDVGQGSIRSLT